MLHYNNIGWKWGKASFELGYLLEEWGLTAKVTVWHVKPEYSKMTAFSFGLLCFFFTIIIIKLAEE